MLATQKIFQLSPVRLMYMIISALLAISIILNYSLSQSIELNIHNPTIYHIVKIAIALIISSIVYKISLNIIYKYIIIGYIICILLLVWIELYGTSVLGAARWLHIGKFAIQPSEITKLVLIIFIAKRIHHIDHYQSHHIYTYIPALLSIIIPIALVIKQPDLGTGTLTLSVCLILIFLTGIHSKYIIISILTFALSLPIIWHTLHDYQKQRILNYIHPNSSPLGANYSIIQSKVAVGAGGLFGTGLGKGPQTQLGFVPENHTDFIFTIIAEEGGFLACLLLIMLYIALMLVLYYMALNTYVTFNRYLILGTCSLITVNTLINILMVLGIVPVVGVPLPLVSHGGTATLSILICCSLSAAAYNRQLKLGK